MDIKQARKLLLNLAVIYWIFVMMIYMVAGDSFRYTQVTTDGISPSSVVGEIVDGMEIRQVVKIPADSVTQLELYTVTFGRTNTGILKIELLDMEGNSLTAWNEDVSTLADGAYSVLYLPDTLEGMRGRRAQLRLTSEGGVPGNAVSVYCGNGVSTGRYDVTLDLAEDDVYRVNEVPGNGKLCLRFSGINYLNFYRYYWYIVSAIFVLLALYGWHSEKVAKRGGNTLFITFARTMIKYRFLIRQLVTRDFKVKYKRSVLGIAWSFLNPLLTMAVQYVVFSTLFQSNIDNFLLYLLSGIVFFNFFSEATNLGLSSIVGNTSLIKKVYIPKYIYPLSRVLTALVNFTLSFIPLLLVMLVSGVPYRASMLLLIFDLICMLGFVSGMSLILATLMTFFQDTQHLWGVISMMWNYLTPIFYPETIIPLKMLTLYRMNPMYQYITFARTCIIDGVSPAPMSYFWCLLSSVAALLLGIAVFKKHQDKFVLYL